jgi:hypothetical protein
MKKKAALNIQCAVETSLQSSGLPKLRNTTHIFILLHSVFVNLAFENKNINRSFWFINFGL